MDFPCTWRILALSFLLPISVSRWVVASPQAPSKAPPGPLPSHARAGHINSARNKQPGKHLKVDIAQSNLAQAPGQPATTDSQLQTKKAPPKLPEAFEAVALLPLLAAAEDIPPELADNLVKLLLESIDALPGHFQGISPADVISDLALYDLDVSACDRDVSCLAQTGRYARAHKVLEIRVIPWGGSLLLQARLIDSVQGKKIGSVEEQLESDPKNRTEQIQRLTTQLLAPKAYVGNLLIRSNMKRVRIYLDDVLIGQDNTVALTGVTAGVHILRVVCEGYPDVHRFVDVHYGHNNTITLHAQQQALSFESVLDAPQSPPTQDLLESEKKTQVAAVPKLTYPSWRTWTGTAVASAGVLGLAAAGYLAIDLHRTSTQAQNVSDLLTHVAVGDPQSLAWQTELKRLNRRGQKLEPWTNLAWGVGGGLVVVGAGAILWDLWRKTAAPSQTPSPVPEAQASGAHVVLEPWLQPGLHGLMCHATF